MNSGLLTAVISAIAVVIGGPGFVLYMNRRKSPTVASVAVMLKEERDSLQRRLDHMSETHDKQIEQLKASNEAAIARAEAKWQQQYQTDQTQIAQLRSEVDSLYRRLYQSPPTK